MTIDTWHKAQQGQIEQVTKQPRLDAKGSLAVGELVVAIGQIIRGIDAACGA